MKLSVWFAYIATLLVSFLSAVPGAKADEAALATQNAVRPRFGLDFDSASGGAEPFTQFESFVPIWQKIGSDLVFFQGQLSFDTDANLGTNLQLGYRRFVPSSERIYGGYLAFDKRGTDTASFDQIGVGLETLGENWDVRLNGYLPLGDRRDLVNGNTVDAGTQISDLAFVGNLLTATSTPQQADVRDYDVALGGFDLEVGSKLLDIGEQGALRGFGGLYYYDGPAVGGSLGWRVRLQAEPTDYLRTGLAVQNDDIFGTNVRFNIGAVLPQRRPARTASGEVDEVRSRLSESIGRDGHIVVDRQREVTVEQIESDAVTAGPVINPATGQPWFFDHVVAGASGDGTFEAPHGDLDSAIATVPTDGNGIIYVTNSTALSGPFTLSGGVQLLSSGPEQFIDAYSGSTQVKLPFSGSGEFPLISGKVTLTSNADTPTVLAGFTVEDAVENAVEGTPSENEEINGGIFADNSLGDIVIRNNTVSTAGNGIEVVAEDSQTAGAIAISGNNIVSQRSGIGVNTSATTLTGDITISDNIVTSGGINVTADNTNRTGDIVISGNIVENSDTYSYGITLDSRGSSSTGDVVISGNVVDTGAIGIAAGYSYSELNGELTISDNTIGTEDAENTPYVGLLALQSGSRISEGITISGNAVEAQAVGIGVVNYADYSYSNSENGIESTIEGGVTITGNTEINVAGSGSGISLFGDAAVGIGVINGGNSTIAGGVNISNNGSVRVDGGDTASVFGIAVLNANGSIEGSLTEGGITIANNESIQVNGRDTDISSPGLPSASDLGTVGIAIANYSDEADATVNGGVTITGNTILDSSEYGIAVVNTQNPPNSGASSYQASIIDGVTIASNRVDSVDDSVLFINLEEINGSVVFSNNLLTSVEDDGIDFGNLSLVGLASIDGDVTFLNNTIDVPGDDVKCTNTGTITGTVSPSSVVCQPAVP